MLRDAGIQRGEMGDVVAEIACGRGRVRTLHDDASVEVDLRIVASGARRRIGGDGGRGLGIEEGLVACPGERGEREPEANSRRADCEPERTDWMESVEDYGVRTRFVLLSLLFARSASEDRGRHYDPRLSH